MSFLFIHVRLITFAIFAPNWRWQTFQEVRNTDLFGFHTIFSIFHGVFLSAIKELGLNFVQETVCCGDAIAKMSWQHFLAFEKDI
jgi:hypothetical protein